MDYLHVFINAIVIALMAMYVYENERKNKEMSARHVNTEQEIYVLKVLAESKKNQIKDMKQLLSTKAETAKLSVIENQQHAGKRKLTKMENEQLKSNEKGVTYIRWGKTLCDGLNTETIYAGQVAGGSSSHTGASVNYICLPNNPEVAQPLKSNDVYTFLYGAEYKGYGSKQPRGIRSDICNLEVACAACLSKGKIASILIPGRKTCYNGWTKEYEGVLMTGYHWHKAASEYACVDRDTEAIAGGLTDKNEKLFYPVRTVCGSLKCPPYTANTEVLCVVCSK